MTILLTKYLDTLGCRMNWNSLAHADMRGNKQNVIPECAVPCHQPMISIGVVAKHIGLIC